MKKVVRFPAKFFNIITFGHSNIVGYALDQVHLIYFEATVYKQRKSGLVKFLKFISNWTSHFGKPKQRPLQKPNMSSNSYLLIFPICI